MSVSFLKTSLAAAGPVIASLLLTSWAPAQDVSASGNTSSKAESVDMEVLMRGPVHEGFAEPAISRGAETRSDAETRGVLQLPETPPEPIDEQPAAARPIDNNRQATWLPGYWGVEEEDQLCWVSGTWRYSPPGMRWVPGYWAETDSGATWVPGFWAEESIEQLTYLPAPPEPREANRPARPGDDYFWVPGHQQWRDSQYVWQRGFWAEVQPSWVWVPARYVATPRGYVYVSGYWDYPPDRRGTLFAPVRFANVRTGYRYRPQVAINLAQAMVHWFVRPNYGHYYFGNYYDDRYRNYGFQPWVAYTDRRNDYYGYYDPIYTYYGATRSDYLRNLVSTRQQITTRSDFRLPVRYREYQQMFPQGSAPSAGANLASTVDELLTGEGAQQFENLEDLSENASDQRYQQLQNRVDSIRRFARGRRDAEGDRVRRGFRGDQDLRVQSEDGDQRGGQPRGDQDQPRTDQPQTDQPRTDQPQTDQPQTDQPRTDQPRTDQPRTDQPRTDQPQTDQPQTDQPQTDQPQTDQPQTDQPQTDQPQTDQPQTDQPQTDQPQTDRPQTDRPQTDRPQTDRPQTDRPQTDRPQTDQPQTDQPLGDRPQRGDAPRDRTDEQRRDLSDRPEGILGDRPEEILGDREMRERQDIGEPGRAAREREIDMLRRSDQAPVDAPQIDRGREVLDAERRQQSLDQQQRQRGRQLLDQQRDRAGAEAAMRGRFDLTPFGSGRVPGRATGQAAGQAELQRGDPRAQGRGEARGQLQGRGGGQFAPPPRLRNPAARGAPGLQGGQGRQGGQSPDLGGAPEAAQEAIGGGNNRGGGNGGGGAAEAVDDVLD